MAIVNMLHNKPEWKGKTLTQEHKEVLTEGIEKERSTLMGGKIYTKK